MPTADQTKLLEALAAGGKATGDAYLAAQSADQAAQADTMKSALAHAAGLGINGEAQGQLRAIMDAPFQNAATYSKATNDAFQRQNYARLYNTSLWSDANTKINEQLRKKVEDELLKKIHDSLDSIGSSGGGGGGGGSSGGGGGGGGGGGRSSGTAGKTTDWLKQARIDAGLVGSGIRSKTGLPPFLRQVSLDGIDKGSLGALLPRDLRERAYLQDHYGAPANELDKAAPISGFLKAALDGLQEAIKMKISREDYIKKLHEEAQKLPGDQRRAVMYARALAMQNLPSGQSPLVAAGNIVGGAPAQVGNAVTSAVKNLSNIFGF